MENLKCIILYTIFTLEFALPKAIHSMNMQSDENLIKTLPSEIKRTVLKEASIRNVKELDNINPMKVIKLVCKDWCDIVKGKRDFAFANEVIISAYSLSDAEFEDYQRFLMGILIYRPDKETDNGRINLRISDLPNPLEGTFDISQCGEAWKHLSISTGYHKQNKAENANKVEIWLTPRFLVEKELFGSANHFKDIFPDKWHKEVLVGIIWTWGFDETDTSEAYRIHNPTYKFNDYSYLTRHLTEGELLLNNLYHLYERYAKGTKKRTLRLPILMVNKYEIFLRFSLSNILNISAAA